MSRNRIRVFSFLVWLSMAILCGAQLFYICDKFFAYDVATDVNIIYPDNLHIPKLVACNLIRDVIRRALNTNTLSESHWNKMTIASNIVKVFSGYGKVFEMSLPIARGVERSARNVLGSVYLRNAFVCFSFNANDLIKELNATMTARLVNTDARNEMVYVSANYSDIKPTKSLKVLDWQIYLHGKESSYFNDNSLPIVTRTHFEEQAYIDFTYSRIESNRLSWPYKSNCFNYTATSYETQSACYSRCVVSRSGPKHGLVPYYVYADVTTNYSRATKDRAQVAANDTRWQRWKKFSLDIGNIERRCALDCKQLDCRSDHYELALQSTTNIVLKRLPQRNHQHLVGLSLLKPQRPDTITTEVPLINWIDFVTYVLSTVGFWFAFSPMGALSSDKVIRLLKMTDDHRVTRPASDRQKRVFKRAAQPTLW